jgi:hypothetical protein
MEQLAGLAAQGTLSEAAAQALAQALDQLDQALFAAPAPGAQPGVPGQGTPLPGAGPLAAAAQAALAAAGQLMSAAGAAQGQAMAQARGGPGLMPSPMPFSEGYAGESKGGAAAEAVVGAFAALPEFKLAGKDRTWGKLPPKLARDLMEGRRERVAEEYRTMVETYFRVVAEKARKSAR